MKTFRFAMTTAAISAYVLLVGCGPCGDVKQIDLRTAPPSQLAADTELFEKTMPRERAQSVAFTLQDLAMHPREAHVFSSLGYVIKRGGKLVFSKTGSAIVRLRRDGQYVIDLEQAHRIGAARFTWETEETLCDEGHERARTYGWNEIVGPLTPVGKALAAAGSLYRGSWTVKHEEKPYPWAQNEPPLHEVFGLYTDPALRYPVTPIDEGGEAIEFQWARDFESVSRTN